MSRFDQLNTFNSVVETGSITAAARRLGLAKSAVSRRLVDLEERLGVQLFQRTTRRMHLTPSGQSFYQHSRRILADLEEAEQEVSLEHGQLTGTIRIAAPLSFGLMHLNPALRDFLQAHPQLTLDVDFNDRIVDLIQDGFDLAIRIARLPDSSFRARHLAPIRNVLCVSPQWLARHGPPETPADLAGHRALVYANLPDSQHWHYQDAGGEAGSIRIKAGTRANNGDFLLQLAAQDQGIILSPLFLAHTWIEQGKLIPVLSDYHWPGIDAWAIYPQTRHLSRRVRALIDFLATRFADTPYWENCLQQVPA